MHTLASGMASSKACDLDIDVNNDVSSATDGVLLLRYLLGVRGDALIAGVPLIGAARSTPGQIELFIASKQYDFDGDNASRAYNDGLLALRLMRGATGSALASGATGTSSLLATGEQISALAAGCR